jgi:hypothetical protein
MRKLFPSVVLLSVAAVMPASASAVMKAPTWGECYQIGIARAVHVEQPGELPDWMDQCLTGKIPFQADSEATHPARVDRGRPLRRPR